MMILLRPMRAWRSAWTQWMLLSFVVMLSCTLVDGIPSPSKFEKLDWNQETGLLTPNGRRLEADPLKSPHSTFHRCRDGGEAYSASYLIHKEHLIHQPTGHHLKWVNCEMASFIMMNPRGHPQKYINGSVLQSVDILDFSVIHLSTFERLLHRWRWHNKDVDRERSNLTAIYDAANYLKSYALRLMKHHQELVHPAMNRTVVIMPFLLGDMGAGHSNLVNRQSYLAACFWSFRAMYPYVTVAVKSKADEAWVRYD